MTSSNTGRLMNKSSRSLPSIFSVNLLYLAIMLLLLVFAAALQSLHFVWGLIAIEALLILLPTIAFMRLRRIPLNEGLRLKPIRPLIGLLCVLLGFSSFLVSVTIDAVMAQLFGIASVPLPADSIPNGVNEFIVYFVAVAVVAPLCEEPLFRGVIQGTYEHRRTGRFAVTIVALMFVFFHFRPTSLPGLLPAAFILGFVAWRTGSIYASMLAHFGLNAVAAVHTLLALSNGKGLPFLGPPAATVGLAAMAVLIYLIRRLQPAIEELKHPEQGKFRSWLWNYSPLMGASLAYLWVAGSALTAALVTGQITLKEAGFQTVHIDQALESRFRITNRAGDDVGDMNCEIAPLGSNIRMHCVGKVGAYDIKTSKGHFKDEDYTTAWSATWDANSLDLLDFTFERTYEEAGSNVRAAVKNGRLVVESSAGMQDIALSPGDLVAYEWAWRINALRPQVITSIQAPYAYLTWWDTQTRQSHPALKVEVLRLSGSEPLDLPAGRLQAWKASVGGQEAWYAKEHGGPVRIDDGVLTYELED